MVITYKVNGSSTQSYKQKNLKLVNLKKSTCNSKFDNNNQFTIDTIRVTSLTIARSANATSSANIYSCRVHQHPEVTPQQKTWERKAKMELR